MNLIKLKKLANAGKFAELESLWPDVVDSPDAEVAELARIVGQVHRLGAEKNAEDMLSLLMTGAESKNGLAGRLTAARFAAATVPNSDSLGKELRRLYVLVNPDVPDLAKLLDTIFKFAGRLSQAVDLAEAYLKLQPGAFLSHRSQLDPGLVESVDPGDGRLAMSFNGRTLEMGIETVPDIIILPKDHFPSWMLYRTDELRELALSDAEALITLALRSSRNHTSSYRDIKKHVSILLGEKGWANWWKSARISLKKSNRIAVTGASQPTFSLLAQERTYADRLRDRYVRLKEPVAKLEFILAYLDETRKNKETEEDLLVHLGNDAAQMAAPLLKSDPALTLGCLAVHGEVAAREVPVASLNPRAALQVLGKVADPGALPRRFGDRLLRSILEFVRVVSPDGWAGVWSLVLPRSGRQTSEILVRELVAEGHDDVLISALREVIDHPTASPEVLFWLWRARANDTVLGRKLSELPGISANDLLMALLQMVDATGRMSAMSDDKRMRRLIESAHESLDLQGGAMVKEIVSATTVEQATLMQEKIGENGGLRPSARAALETQLRLAHPGLFIDVVKAWQENAIYSSKIGLQKRQEELDDIVTVHIPEVAKQIGEAAAHGDLSENSEYTAALEKRDQLTSRATRIENELALAKIIDSDLAGSDYVHVGTKVRVPDLESGVEESYTFLGIWDSDPEQGILSYAAPLSLAFMGGKVGDSVEYGEGENHRRWEILEIGSGI